MTVSLKFDPPVIGHRGASGYAPENTIAAFQKAKNLKVNWVEFDVVQAACDTPIIFHDETLDRTTNGHGIVTMLSLQELHRLDAGSWFSSEYANERIPTLVTILNFLKTNRMNANLEIKTYPGQEKKLVASILQVLDEMGPLPITILFSSFSVAALYYLREQMPSALIGLLLHEWIDDWQKISAELACVSIHVNDEILNEESVRDIKALNKKLLSYTVNDPARAKQLFAWGVDAVFTDVPDVILQAFTP